MKKFRSEEALLTVKEPPPKHLSQLSKKGGHEPATDDRVKNTYTPDICPPKKKRPTKLKAILFSESESILEENEPINLDENIFQDIKDFGKAIASTFGYVGLDSFSDFVDPILGQQKTTEVKQLLKKPLTIAEKYAINKKLLDRSSIMKYRQLSATYNVFSSGVRTPNDIPPELRPGAYEQLLKIEQELYAPDGLEDKYEEAISTAEEQLNLPPGSGRFDAERAGLGRFKYFGRYGGIGRRRRSGMDLEKEPRTSRGGRVKRTPEQLEMETRDELMIILNSYAAPDGLLGQSKQFLEELIGFLITIDPKDLPKKNEILADYRQRLNTATRYYNSSNTLLSGISTSPISVTQLEQAVEAIQSPVSPFLTRMRKLKEKIRMEYGSLPGFPKDILNIPFTWTLPGTRQVLTGKETVD